VSQRIVFYHINKCGGTSLFKYFKSMSRLDRVLRVETYERFASGIFDPVIINRLFNAEFIHDPFGYADWKAALGNAVNILWLRDPAERLISEIHMIARWTDQEVKLHESNERLRAIAREGVEAFLADDWIEARHKKFNRITMALQLGDNSCRGLFEAPHLAGLRELQDRAMQIAQSNLYKMDYIGTVDDYDRDFRDLIYFLGIIPEIETPKLNVNPSAEGLYDQNLIELARPFVHIDQQVYDLALDVIHERRENEIFNRHLSTGSDRFVQRITGPEDSIIVSSEDNNFISNWHPCEENGELRSRWTGPGSRATLAIHIEKSRDLHFRMRVIDLYNPSVLNDLIIEIDAYKIDWCLKTISNGNLLIEGRIAKEKLNTEDSILWIALHTGLPGRSHDPKDDRIIGLCVAAIELGPLEAYENSDISCAPI
tara:strand:- start:175 stop:1455 length:1281 start_codon:yes stop_codon:yes gene_type:complete